MWGFCFVTYNLLTKLIMMLVCCEGEVLCRDRVTLSYSGFGHYFDGLVLRGGMNWRWCFGLRHCGYGGREDEEA